MAEVSPLEVLLEAMRERRRAKDFAGAAAFAKLAAPYVHGRALPLRLGGDLAELSDEELKRLRRGDGDSAEENNPG